MSDEIRVTALDHVVLNVADVERSLEFYVGELGLEPIHVEEWRRGERFFPSVRVSADSIIDLLAAPRTGENADHVCLVVEPMDFDALVASGRFEIVDGPGDPLRRPGRRHERLLPRPRRQPRRAPLLLNAARRSVGELPLDRAECRLGDRTRTLRCVPMYLDRHDGLEISPEELAAAHMQDLEQSRARSTSTTTRTGSTRTVGRCSAWPRGRAARPIEEVHQRAHGAMRVVDHRARPERPAELVHGSLPQHPPGTAYTDVRDAGDRLHRRPRLGRADPGARRRGPPACAARAQRDRPRRARRARRSRGQAHRRRDHGVVLVGRVVGRVRGRGPAEARRTQRDGRGRRCTSASASARASR